MKFLSLLILAAIFTKYQDGDIAYKLYMPISVYENKLGIAGGNTQMARVMNAAYVYSWNPNPDEGGTVEAIPMIWDETQVFDKVGTRSKWIMGFNEPDVCQNQACMTPREAAIAWKKIENLYPDKYLLAPVPSQKDIYWLINFIAEYKKINDNRLPRMNGMAFHCYYQNADSCIDLAKKFIEWIDAYGQYPKEIWCTEFAFLPSSGVQYRQEALKFVNYMENEQRIQRYFPFISRRGECPSSYWNDCRDESDPSLFENDSLTLTDLGKLYKKDFE